ncbi:MULTISPECIES: HAD hydrolase-like protein [unclassified Micromonospora]|uniref:HAD family hydrolase n=1 Tax=unclassified Micromonospora TaxID=2617518 RepID=UPI0033AB851F|nr:HAD hydrolase-like protein [Micromonospora sp. NBC_00858]
MTPAHPHLVWDWNGTLLNDLSLVVAATNAVFASVGGPAVTSEEHRVRFRRPIAEYYAEVLGQAVDDDEFGRLDRIFHDAYRSGLTTCELAADARTAMASWTGSQSLLSMWFHEELVPTVHTYGLTSHFARVDGLRATVGGGRKAESLQQHLAELGVDGTSVVLIGDSIDDADAALAVGGRAVLYTGGFTDRARLQASGHPVADTLTDAVTLAREVSSAGR